jgi:hypothetical protein
MDGGPVTGCTAGLPALSPGLGQVAEPELALARCLAAGSALPGGGSLESAIFSELMCTGYLKENYPNGIEAQGLSQRELPE